MVSRPVRLRLSRAKGFRLQEHSRAANGLAAVKVDRSTPWGNPHDWREWRDQWPFPAGWYFEEGCGAELRDDWCRGQAAEAFVADIKSGEIILRTAELRGFNLACWCSLVRGSLHACHADILLELANPDMGTGW